MKNSDPFSDLIRSIEENLQGNGDWEPPEGEGERPQMAGNPRRLLWFIIPVLIFLFFNRGLGIYTDYLWYDSLSFSSVFTTRISAWLALFVVVGLIFWLFLALNVLLARRLEPNGLNGTPIAQVAYAFGVRIMPVILFIGAIFAFFFGLTAASAWEEVLLFLNQSSFDLTDPIFGRDIGFFIFTLPIWQAVRSWLLTSLIITLVASALVSGIGWRGWKVRTPTLVHLSALGALILILFAVQYRLDALGLVYSQRGAVFGAGYTDVHAQLPAYNLLSIITLITAALLLLTAVLRRGWRAIVVVLLVWVVVAVGAGNIYPSLIQRFQVSPNELNLERPYIDNNIDFTRVAFELDDIVVSAYDATQQLTASGLLSEPQTVSNIRLWDYRPLLQTYNQVQALRQYYEFNDIDIDRYMVGDDMRQVMLAARELVPERLDQNAQTWVNQRLVYTHGYGVAASPVAQITPDGLPEFYIKDLPPKGIAEITRPQIYFGERTSSHVIVRTEEPEFDYPSEGGNFTNHFDANTGINMSLWNRFVFAIRFADVNILLNQDIGPDSQLLWRRLIRDRVQEVAPFLAYDRDPYIVIGADGGLHWFQDAYTLSSRFPYSEPHNGINYIRNSVKVITSAYDGSMRFFVMDEEEPIAAAYRSIFPELFRPLSEFPPDLLEHIRYPTDMFTIQAEVYRTYHMTDANEFYNKEDVWAWPEEIFEDTAQRMEPYYVLMQLPGSNDLDFMQILPFTPANRENMIAWMAAQSDPDKYGQKLVYQFGKDSLFFGPKQVEARIDQDPVISAQLSLWNQQGSNVIRGNLLVIPIAESLIYVEPLYLQAASGKIPELKRVILATADRVVMAENLGLALAELFGADVLADAELAELAKSAVAVQEQSGADGELSQETDLEDADMRELILLANVQYEQAQAALRDGDWARYGAEIEELQQVLEQMASVIGVDVPPDPEESESESPLSPESESVEPEDAEEEPVLEGSASGT